MSEDKNFIKSLNLQGKNLDVGSLDINGSIKSLCNGAFKALACYGYNE